MHNPEVADDPTHALAARPEWVVMEKAALLAWFFKHDEAEAVRWAAQYHNQPEPWRSVHA